MTITIRYLKKVAELLRGIEQDDKLMTVSTLTIRGRRRRNPTLLIVRVVLRGFMQEGEMDKERV